MPDNPPTPRLLAAPHAAVAHRRRRRLAAGPPGATVELIPGSRQATADAAVGAHGRLRDTASSEKLFYASHNWHPFFLHGEAVTPPPCHATSLLPPERVMRWLRGRAGTKTLAYELWEDLGFQAPDNVIIPTGAGSNILGCDLGFSELLRSGVSPGTQTQHTGPGVLCELVH